MLQETERADIVEVVRTDLGDEVEEEEDKEDDADISGGGSAYKPMDLDAVDSMVQSMNDVNLNELLAGSLGELTESENDDTKERVVKR